MPLVGLISLQGAGLIPARLKHRSGTSLMGLFRWERPGSAPSLPHLLLCGILGPSGLAPCWAAVLPCVGGACLPSRVSRGQQDRLCCAFHSQISLWAGKNKRDVVNVAWASPLPGLGGWGHAVPKGDGAPTCCRAATCLQGLRWLERCKEPGKLEMPHGLAGAALSGDAPQPRGQARGAAGAELPWAVSLCVRAGSG